MEQGQIMRNISYNFHICEELLSSAKRRSDNICKYHPVALKLERAMSKARHIQ